MADIKPLIWARKDQVQHALRMPHLVTCCTEKETHGRTDFMPLYDQIALDAAVATALEQPAMEVLRELVWARKWRLTAKTIPELESAELQEVAAWTRARALVEGKQ